MKTALLTLALLAAPAPLASAAPVAPRRVASAPAPQESDKSFQDKFEKAMKIKDRAEMKSLVRSNQEPAMRWIVDTAEMLSIAPSDAVYDRMAALKDAWREAVGTDFCDKMERYFSFLDGPTKRERDRLKREYSRNQTRYSTNLNGAKDPAEFVQVGAAMEVLAGGFESVGDYFHASQCWGFTGGCNDEGLQQKGKADLKKACEAYGKFLEFRDKVALQDNLYALNKSRYQTLLALGFGGEAAPAGGAEEGTEPEVGPAAPGAEAAPKPVAVVAPMTFEVVGDPVEYERPSYFLDEIYQVWNALALATKGSSTTVPRLEPSPMFLREGAAQVKVDADRDGKGDVEVPLRGRVEPVVFDIGDGDARRPWALLVATGLEKDDYLGVEVNLAPTDQSLTLYVAPAGSMVGRIGETQVRVLDDNLDGIYGSTASSWGHVGMSKGNFMPEMDSIVIGESKRAEPYSEYLQIAGTWYRLEPQNGGKSLSAIPVEPKTGQLRLKYKGSMKPSYVIVKGSNDYENAFFDLSSGKPVDVPIGRYQLYFGIATKGKKRQIMKTVIVPGKDSPAYDVLGGAVVDVELGAPYGLDFDYQVEDEAIVIDGQSIVVTGSGGERYERPWGARLQVEASYRKKGTGKGSKPDRMDLILETNQIDQYGWQAAWFPLDMTLPKKSTEKDVEVQLVDKKNKLFGKIESDWK